MVSGVMPGVAEASRVDYFAKLHSGPSFGHVMGHAHYQQTARAREFAITLTHTPPRLKGKTVAVTVAGQRMGTLVVSRNGRSHKRWATDRGQVVVHVMIGERVTVHAPNHKRIVTEFLRER